MSSQENLTIAASGRGPKEVEPCLPNFPPRVGLKHALIVSVAMGPVSSKVQKLRKYIFGGTTGVEGGLGDT